MVEFFVDFNSLNAQQQHQLTSCAFMGFSVVTVLQAKLRGFSLLNYFDNFRHWVILSEGEKQEETKTHIHWT